MERMFADALANDKGMIEILGMYRLCMLETPAGNVNMCNIFCAT